MALINLNIWETPKENEDKDILVTVIFILVSFFMLLYIGSAGGSSISQIFGTFINTSYIIGMLTFSLGIQLYSRGRSNSTKLYASVGKSKNYFFGMILGSIVGTLLILRQVFLPIPQASTIAYDAFVALVYIITVIPFAEEKFFGRTIPFVINGAVKNGMLSAALGAGVASFFHLISKGLDASALAFHFVFRLVIQFMNEKIQSSGFGDIWHYTQNFLAFAIGGR